MWKHDAVRLANWIGLGGPVSRFVINDYADSTTPRPRPFSMWSPADAAQTAAPDYVSDYTSWPSLTDKKFSGRHLEPADPAYIARLPFDAEYDQAKGLMGDVTALFARRGEMKKSRSSVLFAFFAQWFTDSLLRFDPRDRRRNTSNHDIDLCQIYGLNAVTTNALRAKDGSGRLKSQLIDGEEMLDRACDPDGAGGWRLRAAYRPQDARCTDPKCQDPRFADCRNWPLGYDDATLDELLKGLPPARKSKLYATGLERGNSSIGYVAISTIFMREHNRLAAGLQERNPGWSDERLFQTARNINIVLLMKLVVEDYINHILGAKLFRLEAGAGHFEDERWYRTNWIAAEFDLLYRWHGLVPDKVHVAGVDYGPLEFRNNNALLEKAGLATVIDAASRQPAGRIGLLNTPGFLWEAESKAIRMGRDFRLRSFNEYRVQFGLGRCRSFAELTDDAEIREELAKRYLSIDDVEYVVGIFAEKPEQGALFGRLLTHMVAYDAFTQIFSNPLLAKEIHTPATFTTWGLGEIERTDSIQALVDRNLKPGTKARASLAAAKD